MAEKKVKLISKDGCRVSKTKEDAKRLLDWCERKKRNDLWKIDTGKEEKDKGDKKGDD